MSLERVPVGSIIGGSELYNATLYRQALINGNFDIWQRNTTFTSTDTTALFTADKWLFTNNSATNANATISRQTATNSNSAYAIRVARTAGATYASFMLLQQTLETINSKKFAGKQLSVSFQIKVGANWTGGDIIASIKSGTGTDEQSPIAFTGAADEATVTFTPTTSSVKHTLSMSSTLSASKTQLGVTFKTGNFSGTAGANDWFEIEQVQLYVGDEVVNFEPKSFDEELDDCLRYYQKSFPYATVPANATGGSGITHVRTQATDSYHSFPIVRLSRPMFATPTITLYNPGASSSDEVRNDTDTTNHPASVDFTSEKSFRIYVNNSSIAAAKDLEVHWVASI